MGTSLHFGMEVLPHSIAWDNPVSDRALERLCAVNDLLQLERTKQGAIHVNAPMGLFTSSGNSEIVRQLGNWWIQHRRGKVADSNAGFFLEDGSMMSPDAAYIGPERLKARPSNRREGFPYVCPEFVVELLSKSDSLRATKLKMADWIANGVVLGWLVDPYKRRVFVYAPEVPVIIITRQTISGSGPVEGFTLDLSQVWSCYE